MTTYPKLLWAMGHNNEQTDQLLPLRGFPSQPGNLLSSPKSDGVAPQVKPSNDTHNDLYNGCQGLLTWSLRTAGETLTQKPPTLARHQCNHLHELFYNSRSHEEQETNKPPSTGRIWERLKEMPHVLPTSLGSQGPDFLFFKFPGEG